MITNADIKFLANQKPIYPTISLFLNTDPRYQRKKNWLKFFKTQKKILQKFDSKEIEKIEKILEHIPSHTKGIIFFTNKNLWQVFPLAIPIENRLIISDMPAIETLTKILDEFEKYLVVLFDQQKSRLIVINQGEIEKTETFTSDILGRHTMGGWSQKRFDLHRKKGIERHFLKTAQAIENLVNKLKIRRILLATREEEAAELIKKLKKEVKNKIIGQIHLDMDDKEPEIIQKTLTKIIQTENKEEKIALDTLIDNLTKKGVVGLDDVIKATLQGKVLKLIVLDGLKIKGWFCPKCDALGGNSVIKNCPYCNTFIKREENIIEKIIEKVAATQNASIEIIKENDEFSRLGGIGAILRY